MDAPGLWERACLGLCPARSACFPAGGGLDGAAPYRPVAAHAYDAGSFCLCMDTSRPTVDAFWHSLAVPVAAPDLRCAHLALACHRGPLSPVSTRLAEDTRPAVSGS